MLRPVNCTLEAEGRGSREYSRKADLSDEFSGNLWGVLLINSYKTHLRSITSQGVQQNSCCSQMLAKHQQTHITVTGHNCRDVPDKCCKQRQEYILVTEGLRYLARQFIDKSPEAVRVVL